VLCYTGHLSHIKKNPVSNWNYFWVSSLACRIPKEFSRDLWWTLLLCNKFVLRKERERIPLVLSKGLLTEEFWDQIQLPYVDCTFLWLLEGCSQDQRWKGGAVPLRSRSIPTACTACNEQVWSSASSCNGMCKLAPKTFPYATATNICMKQQHDDATYPRILCWLEYKSRQENSRSSY